MGRPRATLPTPPAPPAASAPDTERDEVTELLASVGDAGGFRVRVERSDPRGNGGDYLGTIDLTADFLDDVRERWGGGKYRGRVVNAQTGAYVRRIVFGIAGAPRDDSAPAAAPAPSDDRLGRIESALGTLAETVAQVARLAATPPAPATPPADPLAQMAAMAKILRDVREPAAAPAPAPAQSFTEQIQAFVAVQQMIEKASGAAPRTGPSFDVNALVKEGLAPLVSVVSKKLDNDARALNLKERTLGASASAAPAPTPPTADSGAAPALAPAAVQDTDDVTTLTLPGLLARVPGAARTWLAGCADNDLDPALYADVVLDALPAETHDRLPALLTAPDALDVTARAVPQWAAPRRIAWVGRLYRELVARLTDDDAGEPAEEETAA